MTSFWKLVDQCARKCFRLKTFKLPPFRSSAVGLSFIPLVHAIDLSGIKKIEIPNQTNLSHEHLIQQAASVSVNSATQLLTQTVVAILDISENYRKTLLQMMSLLEESQNGIVNMTAEDNDAIIELRFKSNELKKQLMELNSLLEYVEKVVLSTAEASYLIGAEIVSTALTERLYSLKVQLEEKSKEIATIESECLLLQKYVIQETK